MLEQKFLDRFDMERRIQSRLYCLGSGSSDSDSGGGGVSDEDLDEDLQQDIAAAAVQQSGGNIGSYSFSPNFDQDDNDNQTLINATSDILTAAATAPPGQMQQAVDTGTAFAAQRPGVADALVNAAMTGLPPAPVVNLGNVASVSARSEITGLGGEVFDTTSGDIIPPLGDPYDELPPSPAELFRAQESQRAMGLDQRQAGFDAYQAMLNDAVGAAQNNINNASGLLGGATRFMNQRFIDGMNTRIGDRGSEAYDLFISDPNLFSPVYNAAGRLTGYRDQFGRLTGTDPINQSVGGGSDDDEDTVPPVTNPLTGRDQCPDGFVFDEDLQACRRKTKRELQADNGTGGGSSRPAGDMFFRRTSLDDAPANLPSGFDFDAANRAFTQSFAVRPSFFQRPPDLTGFTLL
jgi:hypothetical protein